MPFSGFTRHTFVNFSGFFACVVAVLVLIGWSADPSVFRTIDAGLVEMKPNVAASFFLVGLVICLSDEGRARGYRKALSIICGAVVACAGAVTLAEWIAGLNLSLDQLLVTVESNAWTGQYPGRMPPQTALALLMLGSSIVISGTRIGGRVNELLLNLVRILTIIALLGMLYGVETFFGMVGVTHHNAMPLITVVMLGFVTTALGLLNKESSLSKLIDSEGAGGAMGRRIIPLVLLVPPLVGLFLQTCTEFGLIDIDFRLTLTITISMIVMSLVIYKYTVQIDDIDLQRRSVERELAEREQRYRELFDYSHGMICIHDIHGVMETVNPAVVASTGYTADELTGRSIIEFLPEEKRPLIGAFFRQIEHEGIASGLLPIVAKDGRELTWRYQSILVTEEGRRPYVIGHALDVTELVAAQIELRDLSLTDELTGLLNRRGFLHLAEQQLRLERHKGTARGLNLLFADMDGLKKINDTVGHEAGSDAIKELAGAVKSVVRDGDLVARWGGDEFVILTIGAEDENVDAMIERIERRLDEHNAENGKSYLVACSIGKAPVNLKGDKTFEEFIAEADEAMYTAKRRRKARRTDTAPIFLDSELMNNDLAWY